MSILSFLGEAQPVSKVAASVYSTPAVYEDWGGSALPRNWVPSNILILAFEECFRNLVTLMINDVGHLSYAHWTLHALFHETLFKSFTQLLKSCFLPY